MSRLIIRLATITMLASVLNAGAVHAVDQGIENLRQTSRAFSEVARQVSPSVVFIRTEGSAQDPVNNFSSPFGNRSPFGDDFFRRFFGDDFPGIQPYPRQQQPGQKRPVMGQGSGFVFSTERGLLSEKAYILTNNHVVDNAEKIHVTFQDGREFEARITGRDPQSDVAVIEVKAGDLQALSFADSSRLEVGEWVVAIGNPFGLSHTLTAGVVSAKGRTSVGINDYEDFIQTDAAINPGNSGGPLVNLNGEVVGINTAIFTRSGGYMGIGFAIPSNLASSIASQLIDNGEVTRGYLGVVIQPLTGDLAKAFDIDSGKGILVSQVSEDSPAQEAGLEEGDVIISYQGEAVADIGDFRNRVAQSGPDTNATITVLRNGKEKTLRVTIGRLTEDRLLQSSLSQNVSKIGITVQALTEELAKQFNAKPGEGLVITAVEAGSAAERAGIRVGSVITQVNRNPVNSVIEFEKAIKDSENAKRVLLLVKNGEMSRFVVLTW